MTLTVPLASLREERLTEDRVYWASEIDGVEHRALVQYADAEARFGVALSWPVQLQGTVRLTQQDWRDGTAGLLVSVHAELREGPRELWSGVLHSAERLGDADGLEFACEVPEAATRISLHVSQHQPVDEHSVGRALWVGPALMLTAAPLTNAERAEPAPRTQASEGPLISILTPVHNPPAEMLEAAVASVLAQTYQHWELELVDDGSSRPEVKETLQRLEEADSRIHLEQRDRAGGISSATNAALARARGEYVALLDHDDVFMPDALERMVRMVRADPSIDMLYSDEAVLYDTGESQRIIKPGWSPDAMRALMYTCHLGVYRRTLALEAGAFDSDFDGCQDYDFVLRLMERTDRVAHIPSVLYHWRAHANSTAGGDQAKPYAYVSQPRAIAAHLARSGAVGTDVQHGPWPGAHRIVYPLSPESHVSLVVAAGDLTGLDAAARSWCRQPHENWSVLLTTPVMVLDEAGEILRAAGIRPEQMTLIARDGPDPHDALGAAAGSAGGDVLLFMAAPAVGLTHDWLSRLAGYVTGGGVAAAGPIVLSADNRIRHAGVALLNQLPVYMMYGEPAARAPSVVANVSALDGVVATSAEWFGRLGGLDRGAGPLALVDYCLRAAAEGGRSVTVPDCRLQADAALAVNDLNAMLTVVRRAHSHGVGEPFYSDAYRADRADFTLR